MRVLMVSDVYKPVINGVSFSIEIVSEALRQMGHEVNSLAPQYPDSFSEEFVTRLPAIPFPFYPEQRMAIPWPNTALKKLLSEDWDIVHLHTLFNAGFVGLWIARQKKIPKVFTYHTLFEDYVHYLPLPKKLLRKVARVWSRHFCNACDVVITPSKEIQGVLLNYGVKSPMNILPTPIDVDSFEAPSLASPYENELHLEEGAKVCLYVGRLAQEKNLDFLLDAFREISKENSRVYLVMLGDGPYRLRLESRVRAMNLQNRVVFVGFVARNTLATWLSHATLFLFASVTETQGMSLAEALLFGLPAVILDGPGTRSIVQDGVNGYVTFSKKEFVDRALQTLQNDALREVLARGARHLVKEMTRERIVSNLVEVYSATKNKNIFR